MIFSPEEKKIIMTEYPTNASETVIEIKINAHTFKRAATKRTNFAIFANHQTAAVQAYSSHRHKI